MIIVHNKKISIAEWNVGIIKTKYIILLIPQKSRYNCAAFYLLYNDSNIFTNISYVLV